MGKVKNKKNINVPVDNAPLSRKSLRKEKRKQKKIHKLQHYNKRKSEPGKFVKVGPGNIETKPKPVKTKKKKSLTQMDIAAKERMQEKEQDKKLLQKMEAQRKQMLLKENENEERIIKKLGKQLKLFKMKPKNITKMFAPDGLDYLLEVCDPSTQEQIVAAEKHLADVDGSSDFENDIAIVTGQPVDDEDEDESDEDEGKSKGHNSLANSSSDNGSSSEQEEPVLSSEESHFFKPEYKRSLETIQEVDGNSTLESDEEFTDTQDSKPEKMSDEDLNTLYSGVEQFSLEDFYQTEQSVTTRLLTTVFEETDSELNATNRSSVALYHNTDMPERPASKHDTTQDISAQNSKSAFPFLQVSNEEEPDPKNYIIVNEKKVFLRGLDVSNNAQNEIDLIRCPVLDKILGSISDSEDEKDIGCDHLHRFKFSSQSSGKEKKAIKRKIDVSYSTVSANKKQKATIDSDTIQYGIQHIKRKLSETAGETEESAEEVVDSFGSEDETETPGAGTKVPPKPDVWEDIYGRKRDRSGNIIKEEQGAYVPPHMRVKEVNKDSQEMLQLKRQIKGVLNKLAGVNLHWASTTIESLYSSHSRNAVSSALCQVWQGATVQASSTPERLMAEHAALIAILQANVGSEIGAYFLQVLVKRFDELMKVDQPMESKLLDNLIAALAHLYSFKIYHANLLYQIMETLLKNITEKNIDCVLVVLRTVGGVLRKDEPTALREFIHNTQVKVGEVNMKAVVGSRIKFLLDVLMAVKNNNLGKIPNYDPSYTEQLVKLMKTMIRRGNYITTLNIGLDDLLKVEERGKWWVVGSAWQGREVQSKEQVGESAKVKSSVDQRLLDLARKQRMNTDIRRDIFCIIMSAEDYMDAFEKLQHLGLKNQQEREIVHVMLACCLQEKAYNPYYAVLAQKFCDYDRKYQLSIQYAIWDKIKDLESFSQQQMSHLAQFLTHLFMEKGLPLSVLKIIEFADLNKSSVRFMRQILVTILIHDDVQTSQDVFQRIATAPKLQAFREKLKLFLEHFLLRNTKFKFKLLSKSQVTLLKDRIALVHKIL